MNHQTNIEAAILSQKKLHIVALSDSQPKYFYSYEEVCGNTVIEVNLLKNYDLKLDNKITNISRIVIFT